MRFHEFLLSLSERRSLAFRIWQLIILLIRSVSILSFAILILRLFSYSSRDNSTVSTSVLTKHVLVVNIISCYALLESCFFVYYKLVRHRLQQLKPLPHRCTSANERRHLVAQCVDTFRPPPPGNKDKPSPYVRVAIEKWFLGTPLEHISSYDFQVWCAWAFFNKEYEKLTELERDELHGHIQWFEEHIDYSFGANHISSSSKVTSIRLSLDPVIDTHRPFIYYLVISIINLFGKAAVWWLGFRHCNASPLKNGVLFRPAAKSAANTGLPVVFIHGIGIGFAHYLLVLFKLPRDAPVILVEWPHVSMQIVEDVPSIQDTVDALCGFLDGIHIKEESDNTNKQKLKDGPGAVFVGHSLGTTAVSWMLHDKRARNYVKSAVMLDPVTFLLINPGIAFNFIHRKPTSVLELLMHYFVSRELFIAHTLSRHFSWSHNCLFPDLLPKSSKKELKQNNPTLTSTCPLTTIYISENDSIVPAPETLDYLKRCPTYGVDFNVEWLKGFQHGQMCLDVKIVNQVAKDIHEKCFNY